jgi:hypothetical protein
LLAVCSDDDDDNDDDGDSGDDGGGDDVDRRWSSTHGGQQCDASGPATPLRVADDKSRRQSPLSGQVDIKAGTGACKYMYIAYMYT